jgi:DNA (cytosine-5)-methyltransferase 1
MKPRLIDLYCGGGGAAMGYYRAGFEVVGVDINRQTNFPFEFHQADAMAAQARQVAS